MFTRQTEPSSTHRQTGPVYRRQDGGHHRPLQAFMRENTHSDHPDAAIVFMPLTGTDPIPSMYLPANDEAQSKAVQRRRDQLCIIS